MRLRTSIGLIGSILWLDLCAIFVLFKIDSIANMDLNQWGDYFSGAVAPVAFFWLILGYFQQGEELRQNTKALKLQQIELQKQVEETAALVKQSELQASASSEMVALERARDIEEKKMESKKRQPLFKYDSATKLDTRRVQVKIINKGGLARNIRISSDNECKASIHPRDALPKGERGVITINNMNCLPSVFSIDYLDEVGDKGQMKLKFNKEAYFTIAAS